MSTDAMTDHGAQPQANYPERFGLHDEPFAAEPDPAFFCADSTLTQRLDMLCNLTEFGLLLLLVIGEPGVGKTSVLQQFLQRANSNWQICDLSADDLGNAHDLIGDLASGFEVAGADLTQLSAQFDKLRAQGRLAVLLVDDAERLPDAALRTLLELSGAAGENNKRLRLVLFGTEALQNKIAALSPEHAENSHVFTIPPLSELQTAAYLRHRLVVAGQTGEGPFTPAQVKSIYKAARGVPANINARARQMLIDIYNVSGGAGASARAAANAVAAKGGRWRIFAAAGVALLLLAIAFWPQHSKDISSETAALPTAQSVPEKTVELALPQVSEVAAPAGSATTSTLTKQAQPIAAPLPMPTLGSQLEPPPVTSTTGKIELSAAPAPETAPVPVSVGPSARLPPITTVTLPVPPPPSQSAAFPPPVPLEVTPPAASNAKPSAVPSANSAAIPAVPRTLPTVKPPTPSRDKLADTPSVMAPTVPTIDKPATPAAGKKVVSAAVSAAPVSPLKAQRPGDYTLQVLGTRSEAAIHQFVTKHGLKDKATILHTTRQGQDWYLLLYGAYPSREAANAALAKLPAEVRASHPWPRSFASLRADSINVP